MDIGQIPVLSMDAVKRKDKEAWLSLFADDAVVEDPVGPSEWDPTGEGRKGKEAIGAFYDMFSAFQEKYDYTHHHKVVRGNEIALFATFHMHLQGGVYVDTPTIIFYKVNDEGKVERLRAFWNDSDGPAA